MEEDLEGTYAKIRTNLMLNRKKLERAGETWRERDRKYEDVVLMILSNNHGEAFGHSRWGMSVRPCGLPSFLKQQGLQRHRMWWCWTCGETTASSHLLCLYCFITFLGIGIRNPHMLAHETEAVPLKKHPWRPANYGDDSPNPNHHSSGVSDVYCCFFFFSSSHQWDIPVHI